MTDEKDKAKKEDPKNVSNPFPPMDFSSQIKVPNGDYIVTVTTGVDSSVIMTELKNIKEENERLLKKYRRQ